MSEDAEKSKKEEKKKQMWYSNNKLYARTYMMGKIKCPKCDQEITRCNYTSHQKTKKCEIQTKLKNALENTRRHKSQ